MITCKYYDNAILDTIDKLKETSYNTTLDYEIATNKVIEACRWLYELSLKFQGQEEM